jgi:hypothetical protein
MSRRWLLRAGVLLGVVLAGALALSDVRWQAWGRLRGEAFYRGRPTSYWRRQVLDYPGQETLYNRYLPPSMQPGYAYALATPVDSLRRVFHLPYHLAPLRYPFEEKMSAATPVLTELPRDGDPYVRRYATDCPGDIGPAAKPAVPALLAALGDHEVGAIPKGRVSGSAAIALKKIDPQAAAEAGVP